MASADAWRSRSRAHARRRNAVIPVPGRNCALLICCGALAGDLKASNEVTDRDFNLARRQSPAHPPVSSKGHGGAADRERLRKLLEEQLALVDSREMASAVLRRLLERAGGTEAERGASKARNSAEFVQH